MFVLSFLLGSLLGPCRGTFNWYEQYFRLQTGSARAAKHAVRWVSLHLRCYAGFSLSVLIVGVVGVIDLVSFLRSGALHIVFVIMTLN